MTAKGMRKFMRENAESDITPATILTQLDPGAMSCN
jgi:hypothetical protein